MPFVRTISKKEATGTLRQIYDEVGMNARFPVVKVFSIRPDLLLDVAVYTGPAHFTSPTPLPPRLRQLIAVIVSKANSCPFCFEGHSIMLQALGFPRSEYRKLIGESESPKIDGVTRELSEFSRKATVNPGEINSTDTARLHDALGDEGNFVEAVWTIAAFNWINRVANSLGVTLDFAMKTMKSAFNMGLGRLHPFTGVLVKKGLTPRKEISSPNPQETLDETDSLYREMLGFSQAPPFYKALTVRPIQMRAWANKAEAYLGNGMLPIETKILIASVAAKIDHYDWLLHESTRWLEKRGIRETATNQPQLVTDNQIDSKLDKILRLAQDISIHSYRITEQRIDELRIEGLKDEEIVEAVGLASFFNGESRLYRCLA